MIGYLQGKLTYKNPTYVYIECNGVGYHVNISLNTFSKLDKLVEAKLFTHMQVREDDISLYGFFDENERSLFVHLISVSGIGTNTARMILSYMDTGEVKQAIANGDDVSLSKIKGIGPKTAKRIILDLREKITKEAGGDLPTQIKSNNIIKEEALSALIALGFPKATVEKHLTHALANTNIEQVEDLIKQVLRQMN